MQKFRRHVECENDWDTIANPMVKKIQRFIIRSTTICIIRYARISKLCGKNTCTAINDLICFDSCTGQVLCQLNCPDL